MDSYSSNWWHCLCFAIIPYLRTDPWKGPPRMLSPILTFYLPEVPENYMNHVVAATKETRRLHYLFARERNDNYYRAMQDNSG